MRAARHQPTPETDERGRLTFNGDWVALSPIEERIVGVLAARFGEVVSRDELLAAGWPDAHRDWVDGFLFSLAGPIYAGTNEIQRNIVAERVLGLPR